MINSCCKCNLRWFEGVVCRKMNCQKEYTALIWAVIRSHNCGLPMKHIIPNWTCRTLCWRVTGQITKFLINPFQRHSLCFSSGSSLSRCVLKGPAKTLDYPGGREGLSLFVSHRLCQTQAPFAKTEQISTRTGPGETLMNPGPLKRSRSGVGGVAWQSHQQPLCRASARRGGEGDGKSGGGGYKFDFPASRKRPGWERKRRRRKGWVRGRVRSPAEEEPGPSRRCAGVTRAKKG